jgi:hypothetical protein
MGQRAAVLGAVRLNKIALAEQLDAEAALHTGASHQEPFEHEQSESPPVRHGKPRFQVPDVEPQHRGQAFLQRPLATLGRDGRGQIGIRVQQATDLSADQEHDP